MAQQSRGGSGCRKPNINHSPGWLTGMNGEFQLKRWQGERVHMSSGLPGPGCAVRIMHMGGCSPEHNGAAAPRDHAQPKRAVRAIGAGAGVGALPAAITAFPLALQEPQHAGRGPWRGAGGVVAAAGHAGLQGAVQREAGAAGEGGLAALSHVAAARHSTAQRGFSVAQHRIGSTE
jgi:hypothetical protein